MATLFADLNSQWLLVPLIVAVSLVYGATRHENWRLIVWHAGRWCVYIVTFLGITDAFLYFVSWDVGTGWYVAVLIAGFLTAYWLGRIKEHRKDDQKSGRST